MADLSRPSTARPGGRLRPFARPVPSTRVRALSPRLSDLAMALVLAGLGFADMLAGPGIGLSIAHEAREPDPIAYVLLALMAGAMLVRRTRPLDALAVAGIANIVFNGFGYPDTIGAGLPVLIALYSVAAYGTQRESRIAAAITVVGIAAALVLVSRNLPGVLTPSAVAANYVLFVTAWILGDSIRTRRAYVGELERRTADLERRRVEEAAAAVEQERRRIARELHDVVTHNVSVMVVQAGAGRRVAGRDPDAAREALAAVEDVGRQALIDMRRLVGVLRTGDERTAGRAAVERAPQPTLAGLGRLAETVRGAGYEVDLRLGGLGEIPAGVDLSAYRIVQEALTNVMKHAGPARVEVEVNRADGVLVVEVRDDGRGAACRDGPPGLGLAGMRERAALFGGELEARPRTGGGYLVRARFPLPETTRVTPA
jgi:signal transduction histidine kinase